MSQTLSEAERKEIGRKLAEARAKKKAEREAAQLKLSHRVLPQKELRDMFNESTEDYETTIVKLIESRYANIQSICELTGMSNQEVIDLLSERTGQKYRQNY